MSAKDIKKSKVKEFLQPMPDHIKAGFMKLLSIPSESNAEHYMDHYLISWLDSKGIAWEYDTLGNIIAFKGESDIYPCIVSHKDTVHEITSSTIKIKEIKDKDKHTILSSVQGIGGDDKNGIFACLYLLERLDVLKVVFFTGEEIGLVGSSNISLDYFDDVGYILQLDRWGGGDFISIVGGQSTVSTGFYGIAEKCMMSYGYNQQEGLITDSINLFEGGVGVSCVNISCGYYQHHTKNEYIDLEQFYNSLLFTRNLIDSLGCARYDAKYTKPVYSGLKYDISYKSRLFDDDYKYKYASSGGSYFADDEDDIIPDNYEIVEDADWAVIADLEELFHIKTQEMTPTQRREFEDEYYYITGEWLYRPKPGRSVMNY